MSTVNITRFPAQQITQKYKYDVQNYFYRQWISELPSDHVVHFVQYGLLPFLKKHGYTIQYNVNRIASCIEEWAFHHVLLTQYGSKYKSITYLTCDHDGGPEEKEYYYHCISTDDWLGLCVSWAETDFLDNSETGRSQQLDLSDAVWHLISLVESPSHIKWLQHMDSLNNYDDDYWPSHHHSHDEPGSYGGERK